MYSNYQNLYQQCNGYSSYISNTKFLRPDSKVYYEKCKPVTVEKKVVENYQPPKCTWCRSGSSKIPGAGLYGASDIRINKDIVEDPQSCNPDGKILGQFQKTEKVFPPSVGGTILEKYLDDEKRRRREKKQQEETMKELKEKFQNSGLLLGHRMKMSFASPQVWGPKAWDFLHSVSFGYPQNPSPAQQKAAYDFYMNLPFMLPCTACGDHCEKNLKNNPPQVQNRASLIKWCVDFHNQVNAQLGKPQYTYADIYKRFQ